MRHGAAKRVCLAFGVLVLGAATAVHAQEYTTYRTWDEVLAGNGAIYQPLRRITDPGTTANPVYTGFFWYLQEQFDATGRYALGMRVYFDGREVRPTDRADIGYIDLQNGNRWTKIGESTAWNWQQGNRLQWRPHSDEILWNDRSDDRTRYVTRVYNFRTGARRTLPRAIYTPSPDGRTALCRDFERPAHPGTDYVGIPDPYAGQDAPAGTGIWKMDLDTGSSQLIMSLQRMQSLTGSSGRLAFFKYLWNPSGTRFSIALKGEQALPGYSLAGDGTALRSFGFAPGPSHTAWHNDSHLTYSYQLSLKRDDGTGNVVSRLADARHDSHPSYIPGQNGAWITADTYAINGYNYLFLFHIPSRRYVPLAKLRDTSFGGLFRIDLQGRTSRNGRKLCIDASHEGRGRQMYVIDIGHILDNPPGGSTVPTVTVSATDSSASETAGNPGRFTISRTGSTASSLTVQYAVGGSASGGDYASLGTSVTIPAGSSSVTKTVSPVDDSADELNESVVLTLTDTAAYNVGSPSSATVTNADNDGTAVTARASSAASGFGASMAIDNNASTLWKAATSSYPQWLQVDLGSSRSVTKVYIDWYLGLSTPYQYKIGVSTDGVTFTTVVDQTSRTALAGNSTHSFSRTCRFVRLTVTGAGTTGRPAAVREFDIYAGSGAVASSFEEADTDGDGVSDLEESRRGSDPVDAASFFDNDQDGVSDAVDPDIDEDGIPNADDPDRDGDGATDEEEAHAGTDPDDKSSSPQDLRDNDGDGLPNGTDPDDDNDGTPDQEDGDRDGDGVGDWEELQAGTDPNDRLSKAASAAIGDAGSAGEGKEGGCGATGAEVLLLLGLAMFRRRR